MANYSKETVTTQEEGNGKVPSKREATGSQTVGYLVYFLFGVLEILLAFRLVLKFLGANPSSSFVNLIYNLTRIFVLPFSGIFPAGFSQGVVTTSVFEPATLVAIIVYAVIAWGIVELVRIISGQRQE
jgi:hypothetical protein